MNTMRANISWCVPLTPVASLNICNVNKLTVIYCDENVYSPLSVIIKENNNIKTFIWSFVKYSE